MTDSPSSAHPAPHDETRIEALLAEMTLDEQILLTAGRDAWHTHAVPRLGIPSIKVTDGPHGARGARVAGATSAAFPCGTALGATWDPALVREVGAAIGREALRKQARVLLGPTVNIHRHPLAGRNFECYSEDPFLTARLAVAFITGVQGEGVGATVKHFVCNDSEFERMTISSEVGERALREIYLAPFEAAVREAGMWALMTSYNRINGTYACDHDDLVGRVLKDEWGFDGLVMSDWWGTQSTVAAANAGLDLEMPGPGIYLGERLHAAVDSGAVSEAVIEDKSRRLLRLAARTRAFEPAAAPDQLPEQSIDTAKDRALIRRAAADATVLLRNAGDVLPLDPAGGGSITVIGPLADALSAMGGGSSALTPHHVVHPLDAIFRAAGAHTEIRFEPGCRIHRTAPALTGGALVTTSADGGPVAGATLEYFAGPDFAGEPVHTATVRRLHLRWGAGEAADWAAGQFSMRLRTTFTPATTGTHRLALTSAGLSRLTLDGAPLIDNWTHQERGDAFYGRASTEVTANVDLEAGRAYALTVEYQAPARRAGIAGLIVGCREPEPADAMERAVAAATAADAAVVVVGLDDEWETEGRDRASLALPGRQDELIARVAAANPRTVVVVNAGSPVAMPWVDDVAAVLQCWYPGQEGGDAIADVLFGVTDPGGRLPTTFPVRVEDNPAHLTYPGEAGTVSYGEGIFVGYRGFDRRAVAPLFPFGHGLSYTTFEYGPVTVEPAEAVPGQPLEVRVTVRNMGANPGREVVQVYVHDAASALLRPDQELKGFAKVALEPGEAREVRVTLDERAFAAWDPRTHEWAIEPGEFEVRAGASSRDIRSRATVRVG